MVHYFAIDLNRTTSAGLKNSHKGEKRLFRKLSSNRFRLRAYYSSSTDPFEDSQYQQAKIWSNPSHWIFRCWINKGRPSLPSNGWSMAEPNNCRHYWLISWLFSQYLTLEMLVEQMVDHVFSKAQRTNLKLLILIKPTARDPLIHQFFVFGLRLWLLKTILVQHDQEAWQISNNLPIHHRPQTEIQLYTHLHLLVTENHHLTWMCVFGLM